MWYAESFVLSLSILCVIFSFNLRQFGFVSAKGIPEFYVSSSSDGACMRNSTRCSLKQEVLTACEKLEKIRGIFK